MNVLMNKTSVSNITMRKHNNIPLEIFASDINQSMEYFGYFFPFFSELKGKAMVAYTKPQQRKKRRKRKVKRRGRLKVKFIDLIFERWQVVRFKKARRRQDVP